MSNIISTTYSATYDTNTGYLNERVICFPFLNAPTIVLSTIAKLPFIVAFAYELKVRMKECYSSEILTPSVGL